MTGAVSHHAHERFARAARFEARRAVLAAPHVAGRPKLSHPCVDGVLIWLVGEREVARACVLSGRNRLTTAVCASCCYSSLVQLWCSACMHQPETRRALQQWQCNGPLDDDSAAAGGT